MERPDILAVSLQTIYLVIYIILLQFDSTLRYAVAMLILSPLTICAMVFVVLKFGKYDGPDLGNDEFGYQDKKKEDLGVF